MPALVSRGAAALTLVSGRITRSRSTAEIDSAVAIFREAARLLDSIKKEPVRLGGVGIYNLSGEDGRQLRLEDFFAEAAEHRFDEQQSLLYDLSNRYGLDFAGNLEKIYRSDTLHKTVEYMRKHR